MKKREIREPKQKRSIETKKSIKKTALHLFGKKGIHATNSNEIAKEAGASIGSFYAYFHDKHALLIEILEDYLNWFIESVWQESAGYQQSHPPLKEAIHSLLTNMFAIYDQSPLFHQEAHALRYSDPDVKRLFENERKLEIQQIKKVITYYEDTISISDLDAAAIVLHGAAESAAHAVMFGDVSIEKERLVNELTTMFCGYLIQGRH